MLPRTDRPRTAQAHGSSRLERTEAVRHEPVGGPVTPANAISCSSRCDPDQLPAIRGKVACSIARGNDLGGSLARRIGIQAAKRVVLPVGLAPSVVGVHLVAGDDNYG